MLIGRKGEWYRPYFVVASDKEYRIENIHFYKDSEILVSTNRGWLENQNGIDIESLELPVNEIKTKRKKKFDGTVFVISKGKEQFSNDLLGEIYIPADMFDVHFVEHVIKYKTQVRAIYKGSNDICISTYIKSIDDELKVIRKQYEKAYKVCDEYNLGWNTENILENLDNLKALAGKFIEEKKRVESLTINDIDI